MPQVYRLKDTPERRRGRHREDGAVFFTLRELLDADDDTEYSLQKTAQLLNSTVPTVRRLIEEERLVANDDDGRLTVTHGDLQAFIDGELVKQAVRDEEDDEEDDEADADDADEAEEEAEEEDDEDTGGEAAGREDRRNRQDRATPPAEARRPARGRTPVPPTPVPPVRPLPRAVSTVPQGARQGSGVALPEPPAAERAPAAARGKTLTPRGAFTAECPSCSTLLRVPHGTLALRCPTCGEELEVAG